MATSQGTVKKTRSMPSRAALGGHHRQLDLHDNDRLVGVRSLTGSAKSAW